MTCNHTNVKQGPSVPRVYGSWDSEICVDCGAWRTFTYIHREWMSKWHSASELADALEDDR